MDGAVAALLQTRRELGEIVEPGASALPSSSGKVRQVPFADDRSVAVIHYHRSLVLSALDRKDDAEKDVEIARKIIGREPDETLF
jgi:hypothetical protein